MQGTNTTVISSSTSIPSPPYSPSSVPPCYHAEPHDDEKRLELAVRQHNSRIIPDGTYVKSSRGVTILLSEQEDGASIPTYPRSGVVRGEVILDDESAVSVSVKLEGRQSLITSENGTSITDLFCETQTLWTKASNQPSCSRCPSILPFQLQFPLTFEDYSCTKRPLPPTLVADFPGSPSLSVNCSYWFTVVVSRPGLMGLKRHKNITIPIRYHPRSRPYLPIGLELHPFFSTVKSSPEEWHQVISTMKTKDPTESSMAVECHVFIPSVQIYAVTDTIPFHVQLRGPRSSLKSLLPSHSHDPSKHSDVSKPSVRVYLLRQVCVQLKGQAKNWRDVVLGEGTMTQTMDCKPSLPPPYHERGHRESTEEDGEEEETLHWEGEVKCSDDLSVASFNVGELVLKDFFILEVKPPLSSSKTSSLQDHKHAHPIRIVTDSYADS